MRNIFYGIIGLLTISSISSCSIIRPGQIGMKQTIGKLKPGIIEAGPKGFNPFISKIIKINVRTVEIFQTLELPTKEGLNVKTEIILLYHVIVRRPDLVVAHRRGAHHLFCLLIQGCL